ncbi:PC-esterase domain-containing protein 1A-like [Dermacentor silvarum]|uniref:PC-esterase domain-containing protein 1A-like n=1 Tax=Dermacentor silvarum TaxID=543639 RepID=UPI0021007A89|nr:PC-esterase domain-containing protein 1A-like [Dermacentor silvarum]
MPHVFTSERVRSLLRAKRLAFLGCSNVRAIYKDLVCLYRMNSLIPNDLLKQKMEESCLGDYLVKHGKQYNGRDYLEERIFCNAHTTMFFYFLTKIHSDYVQTVLLRMADIPPDVVIVSSCLWDITRWGPCGVDEYKENLHLFFWGLRCALPQSSVVIWLTAAPLSQSVNGGFLLPQLDFLKYSLRFHVNEANYFCKETAEKFGFDVIDIHYHLRMMLEYRAEDGIHWRPMAVRLCTNLILTHLALSWGKKLPNSDSFLTVREKKCAEENANNVPDEADAVDGYLSDESSQSNIIGGELIPEKHWYNDVFGYEEIALEQETDRGSPKSDLTYSDTSSSDEEGSECSHRNDLALGDIYDTDEEEEETGVFRDPLGESDAIDINDMIILEVISSLCFANI